MPKKYGITYRFLSEITKKHSEGYLRLMFHRKEWKIDNPEDIRRYLLKYLNE